MGLTTVTEVYNLSWKQFRKLESFQLLVSSMEELETKKPTKQKGKSLLNIKKDGNYERG